MFARLARLTRRGRAARRPWSTRRRSPWWRSWSVAPRSVRGRAPRRTATSCSRRSARSRPPSGWWVGCSGGTDPTDPNTPPTDPGFDPKPLSARSPSTVRRSTPRSRSRSSSSARTPASSRRTYSDGTVTYTATDGASLGVTGGFGGKLDIGKLERGAKVDFGAGVKFDYGSTWTFANADEAAAMRKQLDDYLVEQEILKHDPYYAIKFLWSDPKEPPKPPSQSVTHDRDHLRRRGKARAEPAVRHRPERRLRHAEPQAGRLRAEVRHQPASGPRSTTTRPGTPPTPPAGEVFGRGHRQRRPDWRASSRASSVPASRSPGTRTTTSSKVTMVTTREGKATSSVNVGQGDLGGKASDSDSASSVTVTTANLTSRHPSSGIWSTSGWPRRRPTRTATCRRRRSSPTGSCRVTRSRT